ncbi:hypothetical protein GE21DRAFT_1290121 [Neurospora crassa]|nr:hypothetical protein GE21DRAFT_1290121 [Neurospora crassa]
MAETVVARESYEKGGREDVKCGSQQGPGAKGPERDTKSKPNVMHGCSGSTHSQTVVKVEE